MRGAFCFCVDDNCSRGASILAFVLPSAERSWVEADVEGTAVCVFDLLRRGGLSHLQTVV